MTLLFMVVHHIYLFLDVVGTRNLELLSWRPVLQIIIALGRNYHLNRSLHILDHCFYPEIHAKVEKVPTLVKVSRLALLFTAARHVCLFFDIVGARNVGLLSWRPVL